MEVSIKCNVMKLLYFVNGKCGKKINCRKAAGLQRSAFGVFEERKKTCLPAGRLQRKARTEVDEGFTVESPICF